MTDRISELEKLASLHERCLLSDAEFESEKLRILRPTEGGSQVDRPLQSRKPAAIALGLLAAIAVAFGVWKFWPESDAASTTFYSTDAVPQASEAPSTTSAEAASAGTLSSDVKIRDSVPEIGNCHSGMGECSWSKLQEFAAAGRSPLGSLFRLELLGGTSKHGPFEDYPTSFSSEVQIKWEEHPHTVYVFCSQQLPAVLMETDGGTQVDVLDFTDPTGVPGVLISSASLYSQACHMNSSEWAKTDFATRFGYSSPARFSDLRLTKPTDVLTVR